MRLTLFPYIAAALLVGCSARLPRPTDLSPTALHQYGITVKDEKGNPVEGARLQIIKTDLVTYFVDRTPVSTTHVEETGSLGVVNVSIAPKLAQHWKGNYYRPENLPELLKQSYPHGGRDIWGYFSELRLGGDISNQVLTKFSQSAVEVQVPIVLKAPSNLALPSQHQYRFLAVDNENVPVQGATIVAKVADHSESKGNRLRLKATQRDVECITDAAGLCSIYVPVRMIVHYREDYVGESAHKSFNGLYPINGSQAYFGYLSSTVAFGALGNFFKSSPIETVMATLTGAEIPGAPTKIKVPTPRDYYCGDLKQPEQASFAGKLDSWVRTIRISGGNRNVELERMCHQSFKGKSYISLTFQHRSKFNESKLTNYGIGVLVFDEVVRKLLDPIASASSSLQIDGYKLTVRTQKRNFIDKASPSEYLTYDFYLPKELVRQYKQADISGQKLVNGSIVLLDGERIDLELK